MIALTLLAIGVIWLIFQIPNFDHKYIVKQGKHNFTPRRIGLDFRKSWQVHVSFDPSCKYDIGDDQTDINKLFGVTYITWQSLLWCIRNRKPLHHYNSWRLGWWYDGHKFVVNYYMYVEGVRTTGYICSTNYMTSRLINVEKLNTAISFGDVFIRADFKGLPLKLGGYFGGNRTAPHRMEYYLKVK
jgi:hypothetical protein